ncbi:MAG: TonB-dependent receptor [Bacteroidales bacterium]|nr:TonB-dependent receptor [Bacteroidales bacterium]
MSMLKRILFTLGLVLTANVVMYAQGTLVGYITDEQTKEPLPFVNVIVEQNGEQKGGAQTGMDGSYQIKPLEPGMYDIKASYVGYATVVKKGVRVTAGGFSGVGDLTMKQTSTALTEVVVTESTVPLIERGTATTGSRITSDQIEKMTANSVDGIIAQVGGISDNDGSAGSARGETNMQNYVNGAKKQGSVNIPKTAIAEVHVILGGTPAQYGESIGGTTSITLKPPQNKFEGLVQYRTSEPFDTRGYHRPEFYLTGPIYTKTNKELNTKNTIIGFRLSGFDSYVHDPYLRQKDRYYYMAKDPVIATLEKNPLRYDPTTGSVQYAASYLKKNDFEKVGRKSNLWGNTLYLEGGLDFRLSANSSFKLNGEYVTSKSKNGSISSMLLDNANNGESYSNSYQITANFTQKLSSDKNSTSLIQNVMFDILASYQHQYSESYHKDFKDDFFKYGHIGTFRTYKRPTYVLSKMDIDGDGTEEYVYEQNGWVDYNVDFTPSTDNPGLAAYTNQLYYGEDFASLRNYLINYDNIRQYGGLINGELPGSIYSMYTNVGVPASSYSKAEQNSIYAAAKILADIGKHQVELGFQYDQQIYRSYSLNAYYLWQLMREEANKQIMYRDLANPIIDNSGAYPYVSYNRNYDEGSQTYFDIKLREALGLPVDDVDHYLDIDNMNPSTFSLDMFSADELFHSGNNALVSYLGYDHTGKKISGKTSLQEFFSGTSNGHRDLGAWEPIYMAGYIQDQFYFRDLVFNIGVRVDRFDGNQMGLKDPYLLYDSYTVGELRAAGRGETSGIPNTISDDAIVYVSSLSSQSTADNVQITGFRRGEGSASTWYNANGEIISNPSDISGASGQPLPYRKGELTDTGLPKVISTNAFKDYEPQVVAMPRIAFSFPVSDESEFKASYDIIARRPSSGYWQAGYANYLYMEQMDGAVLTNPNLKPEKITNYELGFQQVLSKSSALTISAYYKQTRDLINLVQYTGADPTNMYYSYDNQDFRTTKGMTISYDLRRVKNIRANASYTLQYAEGTTGLSSSTLVSLIRAGYPNVKMMFPISDDRRHAFKLGLDFRYESGDKYNGPVTSIKVVDKDGNPRVKNIKWLQNFGVNLSGVVQSGAPYTKYYSNTQSTIVGSFRGSRLPWIYRVDLTVDKAFIIKVGKRQTVLDVFCSVYNLFDFKNITGVFGVTGDPDDNGYLTDPDTQTIIGQQLDEESYRNYYRMYLNNAYYYYSTPRRVEIGVSYQF